MRPAMQGGTVSITLLMPLLVGTSLEYLAMISACSSNRLPEGPASRPLELAVWHSLIRYNNGAWPSTSDVRMLPGLVSRLKMPGISGSLRHVF